MFEAIMSALRHVWNFMVKIFLRIVNFFKNIISWFKDAERLKKINENKNLVAVSIKEKLSSGEFNVVNCLFDTNENEVIDAQVNEAQALDAETVSNFGNKEMIVIK